MWTLRTASDPDFKWEKHSLTAIHWSYLFKATAYKIMHFLSLKNSSRIKNCSMPYDQSCKKCTKSLRYNMPKYYFCDCMGYLPPLLLYIFLFAFSVCSYILEGTPPPPHRCLSYMYCKYKSILLPCSEYWVLSHKKKHGFLLSLPIQNFNNF